MSRWYLLDKDKNPYPASIEDYLNALKTPEDEHKLKHVGRDEIGDILVSTVFLGLDHSYGQDQKPVLFETMVFGGKYEGYQKRYHTYQQALNGHKKTVELVNNSLSNL